MARTVGQCIAEARVILQDTVTPYRCPEAEIYAVFTTAIGEARRLRPDLFIGSIFRGLPTYTPTDADSVFPISELYWTAVVNYLVGRVELRDDQINNDGRAGAMLASFKAQLSTATA